MDLAADADGAEPAGDARDLVRALVALVPSTSQAGDCFAGVRPGAAFGARFDPVFDVRVRDPFFRARVDPFFGLRLRAPFFGVRVDPFRRQRELDALLLQRALLRGGY